MVKRKDRIIIDTNLWISYLLSSQFRRLDVLLSEGLVDVLFSSELLDELLEVTQRPKFKKYFSLADVEAVLTQLRLKAVFIDVTSTVKVCRDEKDNFLLALAEDGKASHLITGDKDLLVLGMHKKTKILSIEEYLQKKIDPSSD